MKKLGKADYLLDLINQPAFTVMHGKIMHVNHAAKGLHIEEGSMVQDLISSDQEEYDNFKNGCLYLTVTVMGISCGASITRTVKTDIFILDDPTGGDQLSALSLAGHQLRIPLSNIMSVLDTYFQGENANDPEESFHAAQIKHNAYQIYRVLANMCDTASWIENGKVYETRNICSIFNETLDKCSTALSHAKVFIKYSSPNRPIYSQVNSDMLERAIYNMVSNAVKFSTPEPLVQAELTQTGNKLRISIQSPSSEVQQDMLSTAFTHYLRKPALEDSRFGVGLGMTMIRSAAMAHGGTVLIDQPNPNTVRVSMTLMIRQPDSNTKLRSPICRISNYAGGLDLALLELSELLPTQCYNTKDS